MNKEWISVLSVALALVVIALLFFIRNIKNKRCEKNGVHYDERQMDERGKAYRTGFTAYGICMFLILTLQNINALEGIPMMFIFLLLLFIPFCCFAVHCIWRSSYFQVGAKKRNWLIIVIVGFVVNIVLFIVSDDKRLLLDDGTYNYKWTNLVAGIFIFIIFANMIIKSIAEKKSLSNEDTN